MPPPFDSISKIHPPREAWRLKVRVLRTWIVPFFENYDVANSMKIVLVDGDSNKIQTTVKKQLINRFKESIIEDNYRAAEHEFKLVFLNRTTIIPVPDDDIPKTSFSFCPFDELLKMTENYVYLVDVIGLLTSVGEEKEYVKDAKVMKMIVLELSSKELTIRCALFREYVDEVHHFLGSGYMEQPVVVIQLAKVKFFRIGLQNVMHATRLFFNPDLSEVVDFKNSMIDQGINGTQPLFIANEGKDVSLEDDFMRLTRRCTIDDFMITTRKSIRPQGGAYYCDFCQHYVTNVTPIYRIKIAVEDDNGHGVFVLFDREAAYLLKKLCADLFGEVQKDASVICGDSYPVMFQQLDGKLGKIPSSEDERIVDKREPCEVMDKGITADGNCLNMKTNCRPLINFLGENGAKVSGLNDINTEIDIVRETGKSVDDSVLVDGEYSLKIEGLLNSPPVKIMRVLSTVLDGSPVHVIKKENVSNSPRGKKAKKNLKKSFDDVADEKLGPTSKSFRCIGLPFSHCACSPNPGTLQTTQWHSYLPPFILARSRPFLSTPASCLRGFHPGAESLPSPIQVGALMIRVMVVAVLHHPFHHRRSFLRPAALFQNHRRWICSTGAVFSVLCF
ncbi:Replication protein A 70 kDa DNA-binding subunit [Arachis hypogaea]|nr:Replication protein A 70 kDa DNA-binding subunit [Arachis hypogaea]